MKTSNRLLIALLAVTLAAILSSSLVLKAEYEKIDFKDPFYGYQTAQLPPFKAVKLSGGHAGLIQLQPGTSYEVRVSAKDSNQVKWQVRNDTLELSYLWTGQPYFYRVGDALHQPPVAYIFAPKLQAILAQGSTCKLKDWKEADWVLYHEGQRSAMLLSNNTIRSLSATVQRNGYLQIDPANRINTAQVQVNDSSSFLVQQDVFGSVDIHADSLAGVQLPGALLKRLMR
jgi:hypothetical protein